MLPWFRIRVALPAIDAKRGLGGSFGPRWVSGSWCWAWATWTRAMGGGPRTYPGGVTKWQWKRMLVKRRVERDQRRLAREKSVYEMRQRAEVLAAHPELQQPWEKLAVFPPPGVSAGQQVAGLVRRFERPSRAEDLWSQRDGPQRGIALACPDAEIANGPLSGQTQHPSTESQPKRPSLDAEKSNVESSYGETQRPPLRPYSARWLTMETATVKRQKKEVSLIGKSMQDYLDAFDTDPLGVASEIDSSRSKEKVHRDPLGLAPEKKETAKKKDSPKKKPGKGGRKNRGR